MQHVILFNMAELLDEQEVSTIHRTFMAIADKDGYITHAALKTALTRPRFSSFQVRQESLNRIMKACDFDQDGVLEVKEVEMACREMKLTASEERIWKAFQKYDRNGDGFITADEIAAELLSEIAEKDTPEESKARELVREINPQLAALAQSPESKAAPLPEALAARLAHAWDVVYDDNKLETVASYYDLPLPEFRVSGRKLRIAKLVERRCPLVTPAEAETLAAVKEIIAEVDINHDGRIDYTEFLKLWHNDVPFNESLVTPSGPVVPEDQVEQPPVFFAVSQAQRDEHALVVELISSWAPANVVALIWGYAWEPLR